LGEPDSGGTDADGGSTEPPPDMLPPPAARPPAPPPDRFAIVQAVAAEHPDWLAGSCLATGGTYAFLFEVLTRLRAEDPRWGLSLHGAAIKGDVVSYFWGEGAAEGSAEIYELDVIGRLCPGPGDSAVPGWLDTTGIGGRFTLMGFEPGVEPPPPPPPPPPPTMGLPDERDEVNALAAERPDLLAASCVEDGGNNDFLFELVRRLRAIDTRWGLNWKRGVVGDMSQDVVDYHFGTGAPEDSTDVYIIDVIGGHCGDAPSPAFTDVTEATRLGGTIGRWTLAPLP
jgi:hypothetical protein